MKKMLIIGLFSVSVALPLWAASPNTDAVTTSDAAVTQMNTDKAAGMKQRWDSMTDAQKQAIKAKAKAAWQKLSPEDKARIKQHMQVKKQWSQMSDQEKQQTLENAKKAIANIPPQQRKQLLMKSKCKGKAISGASNKQQKRNAWKAIKQLPPSERANVIEGAAGNN